MPVSRRHALVAGTAAVVVAGAGAWWWVTAGPEHVSSSSSASASAASTTTAPAPTGPPTAAPAPTPSDAVPAPDPTAPAPAGSVPTAPPESGSAGAVVDVVVTYAGWNDLTGAVEAGAYVPLVESDGACTLVLTGSGGEVTAGAAAAPDVSTSACGALAVPGGSVRAGTWQAVVTYSSPRSTGVSAPVTVEVP